MKKLILCSLFFCAATIVFSQNNLSRLEIGGNFGLAFGSKSTSVVVAPQVGYAVNRYFTAGAGINYSHFSNSNTDTSQNSLGLNAFGRLRPVSNVILQAQPEVFRVWRNSNRMSVSEIVPSFLVGAGVVLPMGSRGGMSMMLNYDVIQNKFSPYRAGIFYSVGYVVLL